MVKKASKQSGKSMITSSSVTPIWTVTNILESRSRNPSIMSPEKIAEVRLLFKSDPNVECVIPDINCCVDAQSDGWVSFYNYPFEIGMTFPFSKLVTDFLKILDVSPSQLLPTTWRILACLDSIEAKYQLGIDVSVVSYSYQAKKFSGGLYGLVGRKKRDPLILNLELVHDRGWKNEFFFVKKSSLGSHGSYLRDRWNAGGNFFCLFQDFVVFFA